MQFLAILLLLAPRPFDVLPVPLETPPFQYTLNSELPGTGEDLPVLELISQTSEVALYPDEWFEWCVDEWPSAQFHDGGINSAVIGDIPPEGILQYILLPSGEYMHLDKMINSGDTVLALYGLPPNQFNVVLDSQVMLVLQAGTFQVLHALDFLSYSRNEDESLDPDEEMFTFQELRWAQVDDGILYVSTMHSTYASSSGGRNGYISAIDLETLELLWRTEPLVCNSENFILEGDAVFCGYGFTNEPDFIYVLNRLTGEVIQTLSVPSAPGYLWRRGDKLLVRCYNDECAFSVN